MLDEFGHRDNLIAYLEHKYGNGVIEITPEVAQQILDHHSHPGNRVLRLRHRDGLAADMKAGRWRTTHQGIAFSRSGNLLDGRYRLWAIVIAGVPIKLHVVFNLDEDAFEAIDYHCAARTIRDIMSIRSCARGDGRLEAKTIDPLNYLAYNRHGTREKPSLWITERLYTVFRNEIDEINAVIGTVRATGRTSASVKAALIIRLAAASPEHREYLLEQWLAFVMLEFAVMDPTTLALVRRMDGLTGKGGSQINGRAAIAWIGFGPDRHLTKVQVRRIESSLTPIRGATNHALQAHGDGNTADQWTTGDRSGDNTSETTA
jgi:hypothetical protein